MTKLDSSVIDDACSVVKSELESVFKDSKGKLTGLFEVMRQLPEGAGQLGGTDFALFLLKSGDAAKVPSILAEHTDLSSGSLNKAVIAVKAQLLKRGGACVTKAVTQHVSFVALDLFEQEGGLVPESEEEAAARQKRVAAYLGEMMLHELGHAMGAEHDSGIMQANEDISTTQMPVSPHFSSKSKDQIRRTFTNLQRSKPGPGKIR
jgi:hypothetical protein